MLQKLGNTYAFPEPEGFVVTDVPGVRLFRATRPVPRSPLLYDPGIVIIAQGHKVGYLGRDQFRYDAETYLVSSVPLPFECETHASREEPLLGVFVDIDIATLRRVIAAAGDELPSLTHASDDDSVPRGLSPASLQPRMIDAVTRLLHSLGDRMESRVLGPSLVHEIIFHALVGPHGPALVALTERTSPHARIAMALHYMHEHYSETLAVEDLAREAVMSTSTFHRAFKQVTGQSPLQYVKSLRLDKARSLIVHQGMRVNEAAFAVGYESPSQFSREFKRHFHASPSEAHRSGYSGVVGRE